MKDRLPIFKHTSATRLVAVLAWLVLPGVFLLCFTGCAASQARQANSLPVTAAEYNQVYQASLDVLEYEGYRLDRQDYRFGVITTYPRISPTIFEPWYGENGSVDLALKSTTNYLRRRVSIRLVPDTRPSQPVATTTQPDTPDITNGASDSAVTNGTGVAAAMDEPVLKDQASPKVSGSGASGASGGAGYLLEAQVLIEQVETPRRILTGSSAKGRMFHELREVPAELADRQIHKNYWRVIGRDSELEQRLVTAIIHKSDELTRQAQQVSQASGHAEAN